MEQVDINSSCSLEQHLESKTIRAEKLQTVKMKAVKFNAVKTVNSEPKITVLNISRILLTKVLWPLSWFSFIAGWKLLLFMLSMLWGMMMATSY